MKTIQGLCDKCGLKEFCDRKKGNCNTRTILGVCDYCTISKTCTLKKALRKLCKKNGIRIFIGNCDGGGMLYRWDFNKCYFCEHNIGYRHTEKSYLLSFVSIEI